MEVVNLPYKQGKELFYIIVTHDKRNQFKVTVGKAKLSHYNIVSKTNINVVFDDFIIVSLDNVFQSLGGALIKIKNIYTQINK